MRFRARRQSPIPPSTATPIPIPKRTGECAIPIARKVAESNAIKHPPATNTLKRRWTARGVLSRNATCGNRPLAMAWEEDIVGGSTRRETVFIFLTKGATIFRVQCIWIHLPILSHRLQRLSCLSPLRPLLPLHPPHPSPLLPLLPLLPSPLLPLLPLLPLHPSPLLPLLLQVYHLRWTRTWKPCLKS